MFEHSLASLVQSDLDCKITVHSSNVGFTTTELKTKLMIPGNVRHWKQVGMPNTNLVYSTGRSTYRAGDLATNGLR